jgi:hypothetical protein
MRSALRRFGVALALVLTVQSTRPAPATSQQGIEYRLLYCAIACLYYTFNGQCNERSNEQCVAWYAGCVEGCMFTL